MKRMIFSLITIITLIMFMTSVNVNAETLNGFITENNNKYYYENGEKAIGFKEIDGSMYFFSRDKTRYGVMRTGMIMIDSDTYFFNSDGKMQTGLFYFNNNKYYSNEEGKIQTGYQVIEGKTYFFSRDRTRYGVMRTGIFEIDGDIRAFNEEMQTGLFELSGNKYYADSNGNFQTGYQVIDGKTYFFSRDRTRYGVMRTGIFEIDGEIKTFNEEMQTGLFELNGNKYYADNNGNVQTGYQVIDGKTYFFSRDRTRYGVMRTGIFEIDGEIKAFNEEMQTGLFELNGNKYYADNNGNVQTGYQVIDGKTYFFSRDRTRYGVMRTGIFEIDGEIRAFNEEMQTGLFELNGNKYYADNNGNVQTGYQVIDGKTYFFSRDRTRYGVMRTGMFEIDGKIKLFNDYLQTGLFEFNGNKYYANSTGEIQTRFQIIDNKKYFFSEDKTRYGVMRYGWIYYNGHKYYLDTDGTTVTGYKNIDNRDYLFDDQGRMNTGFVTINNKTYYYYADGSYATDWLTIGNKKHFFNSLGVRIGSGVKKVIDVSSFQGDIDWDTVKGQGNIDGVILRIAAGCEKEDVKLARNIEALKRLGIPYGIYIYSYAENYYEGQLYAQFTINVIKKYNLNPTLGIYLDLESNSITQYMGVTEYTNVVKGYMDVMNNSGYGSNTKIYTYKNYADTALNSEYLRNLITWIAQYNHYCTYNGNYIGWQYSSKEQIPGIKGNVDVSVWFK